jgi:hypothetical protein
MFETHAWSQALPDARSMALSRGDNNGATIVYIGTRERSEVPTQGFVTS